MKISSVKPFVHPDFPNLVYVEITTDEGVVGLGESYYFGSTVAHFINEFAGPSILGKDPLKREDISKTLTTYVATTDPVPKPAPDLLSISHFGISLARSPINLSTSCWAQNHLVRFESTTPAPARSTCASPIRALSLGVLITNQASSKT